MAVYKRGEKGMFYMNFIVNGVRVNKSTGKFTKKEAKLVEAVEKKKLMEDGALSPREKRARLKLSEAIKKVYEERWKHNKDGGKSRRNAEIIMEQIGDIPIGRIDEDVVSALIAKLETRIIKDGTLNRFLAALKTVLRHNKQPWDHIKLRKEPKGRIRVLSIQEEREAIKLLRYTDHKRRKSFYQVADLVEVLLDTGCRLSEILKLKYKDIDFDTGLISIWENKGDKPRSMPMTTRVRSIFKTRMEGNPARPFRLCVSQAEKAWRWVRSEMKLDGDEEFVLHALRHTCASRLVNAGIDLYVVKEWLGHSSIQVTEKYAHLNPNKLKLAVTVLDKYDVTMPNDSN